MYEYSMVQLIVLLLSFEQHLLDFITFLMFTRFIILQYFFLFFVLILFYGQHNNFLLLYRKFKYLF